MAVDIEQPSEQPVSGPGFEWRDYLTPVVGLVIIIAIVIGIFSAIRGLTARKTQEAVTEAQVEEGQEVPTSEIDLGAATTNQGPAERIPSGGAQASTATELPKTGFPGAVLAGLSTLLAAVGFRLRRIRKI